jgi:Cu(I)/Ag(I) efflux system membrane fusion protein
MKKTRTLLSCLAVGAALLLGCKGDPASASAPAVSAEVTGRIEAALADYEGLRAALAGDALATVPGVAGRLESSANTAKTGAPAKVAGELTNLATAATQMKAGGAPDDVRRAFGEASRAVVSLIAANSALAKGRHVFHCPMSQGYPKWVQTSEGLENPYMGKRMLRCGTKSDWTL